MSLELNFNDNRAKENKDSISSRKTAEKNIKTIEDAYESLGGFSTFQILITTCIIIIEIPASMIALSPVLIGTSQVDFYCESKINDNNFTKNKIPHDEICTYKCSGNIVSDEPFKSVIQEWNLFCNDAWLTETFTSVQMIGSAVGSLVVAYFSDRFGRKKPFFVMALLMGLSGFLASSVTNPTLYAAARFLSGFTVGGGFVAHFNYLMEFLSPNFRQICGCVNVWSVGEMLLGLVGYLLPSWRSLTLATGLPAFLICFTYYFLPESPRWLLCKEETSQAKFVFDQISKWNSVPKLTFQDLDELQKQINRERKAEDKLTAKRLEASKMFLKFDLFKRLTIFFFAWISNSIVYYGLSFNMKNLAGNPYLNVFFLGVVDLPAALSGIFFSNRYGRRNTFITNLVVSSCFLVGLLFVQLYFPNDSTTLILVFCLAGRFFNEASWAVMACFTSESFPTICRSLSLSICAVASGLGGVIAPQLTAEYIPKYLPYLIFSVVSLISSITSITLSEMKGKPLEDI